MFTDGFLKNIAVFNKENKIMADNDTNRVDK